MKLNLLIFFISAPYFMLLSQHKTDFVVGTDGNSLSVQSSFNDTEKTKRNKIYLNNDWTEGNLVTKDNTLMTDISFRYDVKNDRFEMRSFLDPKAVNKITIKGKFFTYCDYIDFGYKRSGYFEILTEGTVMLLIRRKINRIAGKEGAYGYEARQDVVKLLFIKVGDEPAREFDKKNDNIIDYLPNKKEEVKKHIESNRLNLKRTKNIIKLINYYNLIST